MRSGNADSIAITSQQEKEMETYTKVSISFTAIIWMKSVTCISWLRRYDEAKMTAKEDTWAPRNGASIETVSNIHILS
jgi:hypothetical protein